MAKFGCGVAPLMIETGRYEGLSEDQRTCPICKSSIENETDVLLKCYLYDEFRTTLFNAALEICNNFDSFSDAEEMNFIFFQPEYDSNMCQNLFKNTSKTVFLFIFLRSADNKYLFYRITLN